MGSGIQKKVTKGALERIKGLEESLQQTVQAVNQTLNLIDTRFRAIEEQLSAIVTMVDKANKSSINLAGGACTVAEEIERARGAKRAAQVDAAKKALEAGVASGDIAVVETIGEKSVIVGHERNKDGTDKPQARSQILFTTVKPEFQDKLRGKGIGTIIESESGTFEVLEVYDLVEKKEEVLPAEGNSADADAALVRDLTDAAAN